MESWLHWRRPALSYLWPYLIIHLTGNFLCCRARISFHCLIVAVLWQAYIIRWLLNHDPVKRPTSKELLKCDYLPPPQMEESELHEVLRSTIANPDSTAYKNMIQTMFMQSVALPAADFAYDNDFYRVYSHPWSLSTIMLLWRSFLIIIIIFEIIEVAFDSNQLSTFLQHKHNDIR